MRYQLISFYIPPLSTLPECCSQVPFFSARRQTPGKLRASRYPSHRPYGPAGPSRSRGHGRPRFSGGLPDSPVKQERHQGNAPNRNATARQAGSFEEHFARAGPQSAARDAVRDAWWRVRRKGSLPASSIPGKKECLWQAAFRGQRLAGEVSGRSEKCSGVPVSGWRKARVSAWSQRRPPSGLP